MQRDIKDVKEQVVKRAQRLLYEIEEQKERSLRELDTIIDQQERAFQKALKNLEALHSTLTAYTEYMDILHRRGNDVDKTARVPRFREKVRLQNEDQLETPTWHFTVSLEKSGSLLETPDIFGRIQVQNIPHPKPPARPKGKHIQPPSGRPIDRPVPPFDNLQYKDSIPIRCKCAYYPTYVTLFNQSFVIHSFSKGENTNKICIHNASPDDSIKTLVTVPGLTQGHSSVVVDPTAGLLVVADQGKDKVVKHRQGSLHWLTLNSRFGVVDHQTSQVQCVPCGCVSVDNNGNVLVLIRCTSCIGHSHPHQLLVCDRQTHQVIQTVVLPKACEQPMSAFSPASGVYIVADGYKDQVLWLDSTGRVLAKYMYGNKTEDRLSGPHYITQHSEGYLLVTDWHNDMVHLVSRDGKFLGSLLSRQWHPISHPESLYLDEKAGLLTVVCGTSTPTVMVFEFIPLKSHTKNVDAIYSYRA